MTTADRTLLEDALLGRLSQGVAHDASIFEFADATHGQGSAEGVRAILADPDSPDAATLAGLLLFPGEALLAELEPLLEQAACSPADASQVAEAVEARCVSARAGLPGGELIDVPLEPGAARTFVARLRLGHNPPPVLAAVLASRYPGPESWALKARLRHCRLEWSPERIAFLASLLGNMPQTKAGPGEETRDVLDWAVGYLESLPPDAPALDHLGGRYAELTTLLKRAQDFHAALAKTSYEVMMAQGARVSLPQPDQVRRELALLDVVCRAVAGRPAWTLAGMLEMDLGFAEDGEAVIAALGGLEE